MAFDEITLRTISNSTLSTRKLSGFTSPATTASPSPHDESIAIVERSPSIGFSVNATPADRGWTIFCTATAMEITSWSCPISCR